MKLVTYRRQDRGEGGNQEPNQTLDKSEHINGWTPMENATQRKAMTPYLLPEETSNTIRTAVVKVVG
jgi:hypothetical protein